MYPDQLPPTPPPEFRPPRRGGGLTYVLLLALALTVAYYFLNPQLQHLKSDPVQEIPLNQIVKEYQAQEFERIEIRNQKIIATDKKGKQFFAIRPGTDPLSSLGLNDPKNPTEVVVISSESSDFWISLFSNWLPIILFIALVVFMGKQLGKGASSAFSFGKTQARTYIRGKKRTTFEEVAGMKEAKEELVEVVDFLRNPKKYTKIGAKIPRGVMLVGAPGTGKTLLARAVAGEANVPFFSISGSEFVEMFVGVGASRVRDLFQKAKKNSPCIVFIDEIDAVGRQRGYGMGGGHDEREQTLNQILTEMDGFENETNVIVVAATNRPDVLDAALLRPGRFDRRVIIDLPNLAEREEILKVHARNKPLESTADLKKIAQQTPGFAGADLENLLNEAAILAAKKNKKTIAQTFLEQSIEKVTMGPERQSRVLSDKEKRITAYHEVGHALVGKLLPHCDPVHKVSIISRGMALGVTWFLPEEDKHLYSESKFKDEMCSALGGYVAERLTFGEVTTGASSDLQKATNMARRMVTEYGMNKGIGPVIFGEKQHGSFLGAELGSSRNYSEAVAAKIDAEVGALIKEAEKRTEELLKKNNALLEEISEALLKKETLDKTEFDAFFEKGKGKK